MMRLAVVVAAAYSIAFAQEKLVTSEKVIATVSGKSITASDLSRIASSYPASVQQAIAADPAEFLRRYAAFSRALEAARAAGLDQRQPYKFQIESILFGAYVESFKEAILILPGDQQKYYDQHKDKYKDQSFEKVRDDIYKELFDQAHRKKMEALTQADVKVLDPQAFKDYKPK